MKNHKFSQKILSFLLVALVAANSVIAVQSIALDGTGEVKINDANSMDYSNKATWNFWVRQDQYTSNAGLVGKYAPRSGQRSYLIRAANTNEISVILSPDGSNTSYYSSDPAKDCGIRNNNEWTMLSVTYDGSQLDYYRNGAKCDSDQTNVGSLYSSPSPVRIGGGNNVYLTGGVDEFTTYNQTLAKEQIKRLYDESVYGLDLGQSIPVLVYHKVKNNADETISVSEDDFSDQMQYLHDNGFNPRTIRHYNNWRKGTYTMPKKAVIIVFDDGWSSVYDSAKPIMDEFGYDGSIALVTRYASFTDPDSGYMNWTQVKELSDDGWSIESHGVGHEHMLNLTEQQFRDQLSNSKTTITQKMGKTPPAFVFPFHEADEDYTGICGEYYSLCFTQGSMNPSYDFKSTPGKEYLRLRRINVTNATSFQEFKNFLGRDTDKASELYMNEGQGVTTDDTSGKNNDGSLLNGATWTDESVTGNSGNANLYSLVASAQDSNRNNGKDNSRIVNCDNRAGKLERLSNGEWPENMAIEEDSYYPGLEFPCNNGNNN